MSDPNISRREALRNVALSVTLGAMTAEAAQHVHHAAAEEKKAAKGVYKPGAFTAAEYRTIQRLADLIIPADDVSKGALEAGAPEFLDILASHNDELKAIYTGGLAWLDRAMEERFNVAFVDARPEQQTQMLDVIAFRRNDNPENGPGIVFFDWIRKMVVDAFYTSPVGVKDLGYLGNKGMTTFQVPVAAIDYAVKRSGLG